MLVLLYYSSGSGSGQGRFEVCRMQHDTIRCNLGLGETVRSFLSWFSVFKKYILIKDSR